MPSWFQILDEDNDQPVSKPRRRFETRNGIMHKTCKIETEVIDMTMCGKFELTCFTTDIDDLVECPQCLDAMGVPIRPTERGSDHRYDEEKLYGPVEDINDREL